MIREKKEHTHTHLCQKKEALRPGSANMDQNMGCWIAFFSAAYNLFWSECQGVHNAAGVGRLVHVFCRRGSGSRDFVSTTPLK